MNKNPNISVFFPCFNDSYSIQQLVENAFDVLNKISNKHEVIVVDDGSSDNSREVLKDLAQKYKNLKLVFHQKNEGYGATLSSGFKNASYELIFYTDGDGQYDVKELPRLLELMTSDVDFVNGVKMNRSDPTYRILAGYIYKTLMRNIFKLPIQDVNCDFRLIKKRIIDKINFQSKSGAFGVELVKKAQLVGARFKEIPVHHYERKYGSSQFFKPKRLFVTGLELIRLLIA